MPGNAYESSRQATFFRRTGQHPEDFNTAITLLIQYDIVQRRLENTTGYVRNLRFWDVLEGLEGRVIYLLNL